MPKKRKSIKSQNGKMKKQMKTKGRMKGSAEANLSLYEQERLLNIRRNQASVALHITHHNTLFQLSTYF